MPPSILAAADRIRRGELTPLDLVEECLARIQRFEPAVRAWVLVDEEGARRTSQQLGEEAAQGRVRGPLHGIPIGIKDIIDVAGFPTRAGSTLTDDRPAAHDATVVARLREAGAIILGKTVTTQFASFDPPPTRNPWNLERTPGGSSSGSAAAVALGMCLGALGTQTGGSIIRPASYCGVAGCKPSYGRVSLTGIVPLAFHMDHPGPIAGQVEDLALLLGVMAGYDPRDPVSVPAPAPDDMAIVPVASPAPRFGLVQDAPFDVADEMVLAVIRTAIDQLRMDGAEIVPVKLPSGFAEVPVWQWRIMAVEAADFHRRWFPARRQDYGPKIAALLDEGLATSAIDYAAALREQRHMQRELLTTLHGFDALLLPATPTTAPSYSTTGDPRFNSPWSYSGLPVVSLPCGLAADGLPVALQLVGHSFGEAPLLKAATWCERRLEFTALPPLLGP